MFLLHRRERRWILTALVVVGFSIGARVQGSPVPSYTVTDLGSADAPKFGKESSGRSVVYSADGSSAYAFSPTATVTGLAQDPPHQWIAPVGDSTTNGDPKNAYDQILTGAANHNGLTAFIETNGVYGHANGAAAVFVGRSTDDGGWETLSRILYSSHPSLSGMPSANGLAIYGVDDRDQVLASTSYDRPQIVLYDAGSNSITDLSKVVGPGYSSLSLGNIHLDDDGRILVSAFSSDQSTHQLLLTPSDLSAAPVPEPSTLVAFGLGAAALACRRARRHAA